MSMGSLVALKNAVRQICQQSEGKMKKLYQIVAAGQSIGQTREHTHAPHTLAHAHDHSEHTHRLGSLQATHLATK